MDRQEALHVIEAALEKAGRPDVLEQARRAFETDETDRPTSTELASAEREVSARLLLESMPDGVMVHREMTILYANAAAVRMLGYPPGTSFVGSPILNVLHPDDRASARSRVEAILKNFGVQLPLSEQRLVRRDGSLVVAELSATGTIYDGKPAILSIARDITARKQMESEFVVNDRLAALGRLAASVGHELNNPLAYVLGNVTLMERELARDGSMKPEVRDHLASCIEMIKEGAERMRDIVHDLKTVSRGDGFDHVQVEVQQILDVCMHLTEHEMRSRARIVRDYRQKVFVRGSGPKLGQIFLNVLTYVTRALDPKDAATNEVKIVVDALDERWAVVEISRTGETPTHEELNRMFEPFSSLRHAGPTDTTGLGMSIVHQMVTASGGTILAEPLPDHGVRFRIVLPMV